MSIVNITMLIRQAVTGIVPEEFDTMRKLINTGNTCVFSRSFAHRDRWR